MLKSSAFKGSNVDVSDQIVAWKGEAFRNRLGELIRVHITSDHVSPVKKIIIYPVSNEESLKYFRKDYIFKDCYI